MAMPILLVRYFLFFGSRQGTSLLRFVPVRNKVPNPARIYEPALVVVLYVNEGGLMRNVLSSKSSWLFYLFPWRCTHHREFAVLRELLPVDLVGVMTIKRLQVGVQGLGRTEGSSF
jgi:hypothetical protein